MTALYSIRTILFLFLKKKRNEINPLREETWKQGFPLIRLVLGVFGGGWVFAIAYFPPLPLLIPLVLSSLPLALSTLAVILRINWKKIAFSKKSYLVTPTYFSRKNWFFVHLIHPIFFFQAILKRIWGVLRTLDQGWTATFGPTGVAYATVRITQIILKGQRGLILNYFIFTFMLTSLLLLLFFFLP
jgi:NADH:ubiquinone oxidoreductase subunit 5 (subunit L)/multisubunit Na+/H+ antiporter MnhA subunit